jgi:hypothetical protein
VNLSLRDRLNGIPSFLATGPSRNTFFFFFFIKKKKKRDGIKNAELCCPLYKFPDILCVFN